jgi:hypothetical protein
MLEAPDQPTVDDEIQPSLKRPRSQVIRIDENEIQRAFRRIGRIYNPLSMPAAAYC